MHVVVTVKNLKVGIKTKEQGHSRPHAHAECPGAEASIALDDFEVLGSNGFNEPTLNRIVKLVRQYQFELLEKWKELHGQED